MKALKSLSVEQLDALLTVTRKHSEQDYLMLLVTYNHGLRSSETLALTKANIMGDHLVVQRLKGSEKTDQPLQPGERDGLLKLAAEITGRFFPMSRMTFWRKIQEYGIEAGIPSTMLHAHILKHTCGRLAYKGGMGIPEIQTWLGHVNGANSMRYMQATEQEAAAAFAAAAGR